MGRQLTIVRPSRPAPFPRVGEPIVPLLLHEVILDRYLSESVWELDLSRIAELGADAWRRLSTETCRRAGAAVVDRVQTRLQGLPPGVLAAPMPDPATALGFRLERRTANTLRRAVATGSTGGGWTLRRYLELPRFGGRATVDLIAAAEARGGSVNRQEDLTSGRALDAEVTCVARNLPISEPRAREQQQQMENRSDRPIDLWEMVRAATRRGRSVPFRVVEIRGVRIAVGLSQVTAARIAHRIASRAVAGVGAGSVPAIAAQLRETHGAAVNATFVERLLCDLPGFRWVERSGGWFWFVGPPKPLSRGVRSILAAKPVISDARLLKTLRRDGYEAGSRGMRRPA